MISWFPGYYILVLMYIIFAGTGQFILTFLWFLFFGM